MRISGQPPGLEPQVLADDRLKNQAAKAGENNASPGVASGQERPAPASDATIDGRRLSLIGQSAHQGDEIRLDKVAALQKAIADGSYHVPAEKIAAAMLREMAS